LAYWNSKEKQTCKKSLSLAFPSQASTGSKSRRSADADRALIEHWNGSGYLDKANDIDSRITTKAAEKLTKGNLTCKNL
jgi:hypothetical protein